LELFADKSEEIRDTQMCRDTMVEKKIFGKFRETFGGLKPLFIFGPVLTIEIPVFRNFGKVKSPEIFF
jgi:hypothetical protein